MTARAVNAVRIQLAFVIVLITVLAAAQGEWAVLLASYLGFAIAFLIALGVWKLLEEMRRRRRRRA